MKQCFIEKLIVTELVKNFPKFKEPEDSLPRSQKPANDHIPSQMNTVQSLFRFFSF
jgi:hypothetical protein